MTYRMKDPEDAERLWHLKYPEQLEMEVEDSEGDVVSFRVRTNTKLRDDDMLYMKIRKRGTSGRLLKCTWTSFVGRVLDMVIDAKTVTINTTGGQVVLYRS